VENSLVFSISYVDNETWVFDPSDSSWTLLNPTGDVPSPRITPTAARSGDKLYVFGGVDITFAFLNDMYIYDTNLNTFTQITDMSGDIPPGVSDPGIDIKGGYLYLQGGEILTEEGIGNLVGLYRFDLDCHVWEFLTPSPAMYPHPERDAQVFSVHKNKIWMFGGDVDGDNFFNLQDDTWVYDIAANSWTQIYTSRTPPASKRNSWAWHKGELYVFIAVIGPETFGASIESQQVWKLTP